MEDIDLDNLYITREQFADFCLYLRWLCAEVEAGWLKPGTDTCRFGLLPARSEMGKAVERWVARRRTDGAGGWLT
jgi:RNase P protein component